MGGFITCLALLIGYMIYRLVALWQTLTGSPETDPYFFSRKTMTVFGMSLPIHLSMRMCLTKKIYSPIIYSVAGLTLFMTILALINAIVMLYNFNKGLKEASKSHLFIFHIIPGC